MDQANSSAFNYFTFRFKNSEVQEHFSKAVYEKINGNAKTLVLALVIPQCAYLLIHFVFNSQ